MSFLTLPKYKGIVVDTNVLSLLARAQRLDLLHHLITLTPPIPTLPPATNCRPIHR